MQKNQGDRVLLLASSVTPLVRLWQSCARTISGEAKDVNPEWSDH